MPDEWEISDADLDSLLGEWEAVDHAASTYLAERVPGVRESLADGDARWLDQLTETISPSEAPQEHEVEAVSAVMALQHADWLGLGERPQLPSSARFERDVIRPGGPGRRSG